MAINTYRFWMATDANRLLANQNAFIQAAAPSFYQGNVAQLELHIVASAGVGTSPIEIPFPAGAAISVAVGDTNTYPTGGAWGLVVGTAETDPVPYNATTIQVADALNALTEVSTVGGVTVSKTGDGYTITWNTLGSKPAIGIGSDTLTPSSYESISLVQEGSAERRQIVFVELRQNPIALGTTWTALPTPSVTVSEVQAWNGTNRIWRVTINPQPRAGTMTISYGSKMAIVAYNASTSSIASMLSPAQVFSTGQYQWDISISEDSVLTATGSLVGYNGFSGSINFATAECHQFLAGAERKSTVLEVSISLDSKRYTLIQTACNVFADVVSDGVLVPLVLGTAISEQVANARFVRRDIDQNPDTLTQNVIWQNLGVNTIGSDIVGAIDNSDSPSAANPFATISDIPTVLPVDWGNITGTLSNQTDLNLALADKYPTSNPAGYIDLTTAGLYFYPLTGNPGDFATQAWVIGQNYLTIGSLAGYATESWVNNELTIYATQSWVTGQGYITASALSPYLTSATAATTYALIAQGLPASGTTGQVLSKVSGTDYDVTWTSFIPGDRYLTTSTDIATIGNGVKTFTVDTGLSYTATQDVTIAYDAGNHMHATVTTYNPTYGILVVDVQRHTGSGTYATWTVNVGGAVPLASVAWGAITGTLGDQTDLSSALAGYAPLSGATFTGKVNTTTTATTAPINLAGPATAPSTTVAGDLWIGASINYKSFDGVAKVVANTNATNHFTSIQTILVNNTGNALRINQQGTGNALVVEDSTSPDATPFVIDANGRVGIGVAPDASAALGVDAGGIKFYDGTTQVTAALPLSGGAMTGSITNTFNGMATEVSEQKFKVGLTGGSLFAELNYQALTINNPGSQMTVTPTGLTFPDATTQTTAGYPNSNPSGFVTSGDVAAYYYPLSNPNGYINDYGIGYGPLYARQNGGWTAFTVPPAPTYSESVWYYNSWQSATIRNVYDPNSYSYYNVLTF